MDFVTDRLTRDLAREIEAALFVENSEGRIDAELEAMLAKQDSTETVDRGNGRRGQNRDCFHPSVLFRV